ncbi:hypothetical protein GOP47_0004739 [Adiantum capillus-veneris]|uniref:GINS subunit domain-containing protein n=1 Tax=Adiantum capillus-veneris TaxID=13818 RepID=A0A9D4V3U1_ADICA|nr:hypothetical protein GOP47_0004739 [Adiantum capillus-veneris]
MSSYYDLEDLLAEEEPVSVLFRVAADGVGILDPSSEDNNVEQGAKVDLPLWLAQDLFQRQAAFINLPSYFNQRVRKEMQADPGCVDIRSRCPYFYGVGCKLVPLTNDATLGSFLLYTLRGRYKDILCKSHSAAVSSTPKVMQILSREETILFQAGRESMTAFKKWRMEGTRMERAAVLGKKRKPQGEL